MEKTEKFFLMAFLMNFWFFKKNWKKKFFREKRVFKSFWWSKELLEQNIFFHEKLKKNIFWFLNGLFRTHFFEGKKIYILPSEWPLSDLRFWRKKNILWPLNGLFRTTFLKVAIDNWENLGILEQNRYFS